MKALKRIALDGVEAVVKLSIERIWEWSEQFRVIPWLSGVKVGPIQTIGAGNVTIEHKLGRVPQGFIVIAYEGAAADAYPSVVSKDDRFMTVNFGGSTLVTLWVWG
jgi:hypothetical protein